MSSYKVSVYGASTFVNTGTTKDGKPYATIAPVKIRKQKDGEWIEAASWFLEDAYRARALLDKAIAFAENEIAPVTKFEKKGEPQSKSSSFDDDDIPF